MTAAAALQVTAAKPLAAISAGPLLQRKCACGGSGVSLSGQCDECQGKRLQRKIKIGATNDPLEAEADRIADEVMRGDASSRIGAARPQIQRASIAPRGEGIYAPPSVERVLARPGRPLEPGLKQDMEQRFGYDFSRVRVHSDVPAAQSAKEVNAIAYVVGSAMVFDDRRYAPSTPQGRALVAHELAHVVQQEGANTVVRRQSVSNAQRNVAMDQGVSSEKWSEQIEQGYRRMGNLKVSEAIRDCRLLGGRACSRILTSAEVHALYARDVEPGFAPATAVVGGGRVSAAQAGMGAAALAPAALKVLSASLNNAGLLNYLSQLQVANSNVFIPTAEAATAAEATAAIEAGAQQGVAEAAVRTAPAAAGPLAIGAMLATSGIQMHMMGQYQARLRAHGFVLLEPPQRVCQAGCHYPAVPQTPIDDSLLPAPFEPMEFKGWPTEVEASSGRTRRHPLRDFTPQPDAGPQPDAKPQPEGKEYRRRARWCRKQWIPRQSPDPVHDEFAREVVRGRKLATSPDLEFAIYRGKDLQPIEYDIVEPQSGTFYEVKTRYEFLHYREDLPVTWYAKERHVAQAKKQKETMRRCGFDGDLVWVFDTEIAASAVRAELTADSKADAVISHRWSRPGRRAGRSDR